MNQYSSLLGDKLDENSIISLLYVIFVKRPSFTTIFNKLDFSLEKRFMFIYSLYRELEPIDE